MGCRDFGQQGIGRQYPLFQTCHHIRGQLIIQVFCDQIRIHRRNFVLIGGHAPSPFDFPYPLCQLHRERAFLNLQADFASLFRGQTIVQIGQQCAERQSHWKLPRPIKKQLASVHLHIHSYQCNPPACAVQKNTSNSVFPENSDFEPHSPGTLHPATRKKHSISVVRIDGAACQQ